MSGGNVESVQGKSGISGHVYSKSGALLNGAKVTCEDFETLTLADGFYIFDKLRLGTYEIKVSLKGFQSESEKISIKDSETAIVDFYLDKAIGTASISGHVYDSESGKPIVNKGTIIMIIPITNRYAYIGANGYYEFSNLPAGTYNVSASIPEYYDCDAVLSIAEDEFKEHDFYCKVNKTVEPPWG